MYGHDPKSFDNARLIQRLYEVENITNHFHKIDIKELEKDYIAYRHNDYPNILFSMENGTKNEKGVYLKTFNVIIDTETPLELVKKLELEIVTAKEDLLQGETDGKYKLRNKPKSRFDARIYSNNQKLVKLGIDNINKKRVFLSITSRFYYN